MKRRRFQARRDLPVTADLANFQGLGGSSALLLPVSYRLTVLAIQLNSSSASTLEPKGVKTLFVSDVVDGKSDHGCDTNQITRFQIGVLFIMLVLNVWTTQIGGALRNVPNANSDTMCVITMVPVAFIGRDSASFEEAE